MKQRFKVCAISLVFSGYLFIPLTSYGVELDIYALNVGQGDSTLIITPSDKRILIDGGRDSKVINEIDNILPFWDRDIDILMLSHPDSDHVAGLVDVLGRYKVGKILENASDADSEAYRAFIQKAAEVGVPRIEYRQDDQISSPDGTELLSLWPTVQSQISNDTNSGSQVILLRYAYFSGLLTGDIDTEIANELDRSQKLYDIDYLKVPHHGSRHGFKPDQIKEMSPLISTISVGLHNNYGHPSPETVAGLLAAKSHVYQTSTDGTVHVSVDIAGISVSSE